MKSYAIAFIICTSSFVVYVANSVEFSGHGDSLTLATAGKMSRFTLVANDLSILKGRKPTFLFERINPNGIETSYQCIDTLGHANYCNGDTATNTPWYIEVSAFDESQPQAFLAQFNASTQSGAYSIQVAVPNQLASSDNILQANAQYLEFIQSLSVVQVLPELGDQTSEIRFPCPALQDCRCPQGYRLESQTLRSYCSPCSNKSACTGQIPTVTAGELNYIIIPMDRFRNRVTSSATTFASLALQPSGQQTLLTMQISSNGNTIASLFATQCGQYSITAFVVTTLGTVEIFGSPLVFNIVPAEINPNISLFDAPTVFTAGLPSAFMIMARDQFGNAIPGQVCSGFFVTLVPISTAPLSTLVPCTISPSSNGGCRAFCIPPWVGTLNVTVTFESQHMSGSPLAAEVQPGITCATKCLLSGAALTLATAGQPGYFVLVSRDRMGNARLISDDHFAGALSGPSQAGISLVPWTGGRHNASYTATCAGRYSVTVRLGGLFDVGDSAPPMVVWPGPVCASSSAAAGDGLTVATSSMQAGFVVMARDQFGNHLLSTAVQLQVSLGNSSLGVFIADSSATFRVKYTTFTSGVFFMTATLANMPVFNNVTVLVHPASVRSTCCSATGAALTLRTAGATAIFTIVSSDCFGRQRSLAPNQEVAVQSSTGENVGALAATYYEGIFEYPVVPAWAVDGLDFSSPGTGTGAVRNWISAKWSGRLWTPGDDLYSFYSRLQESSERMKLWIDGNLLVDMVGDA